MKSIKGFLLKDSKGKILVISNMDGIYFALEDPKNCTDEMLMESIIVDSMMEYFDNENVYDENTGDVIEISELERVNVGIIIDID